MLILCVLVSKCIFLVTYETIIVLLLIQHFDVSSTESSQFCWDFREHFFVLPLLEICQLVTNWSCVWYVNELCEYKHGI